MATRLAVINAARNPELKGKTHPEIDALAKKILMSMSGSEPLTNEGCAYFNQVMIEYHLARVEIDFAHDAAMDYFDASDSALFEFDGSVDTRNSFLEANEHDAEMVAFFHSASIGDDLAGCERIA